MAVVDGWANFTNLALTHSGYYYKLQFDVTYPDVEFETLESAEFNIMVEDLEAVVTMPTVIEATDEFSVEIYLRSVHSQYRVTDVYWKVCKAWFPAANKQPKQ